MRIYVKSVVSLDNLREQAAKSIFDVNPENGEEIFKQLIDVDPTADYTSNRGGKYAPWIIRQHNSGNLTEDEYTNLHDALSHFAKSPKKYTYSDLGQYKTVKDFLSDSERVGNIPLTEKERAKLVQKQARRSGDSDKEFLAQDGVWELWKPLTHAGSVALSEVGGDKARWCTAYAGNDYYFNHYTKNYSDGNLYIFINTSDPSEKYQLHFDSNSWYDRNDTSLGMNNFYQFIADKPVFSNFFKVEDFDGILVRRGIVIKVSEELKSVVIPDSATSISSSVRFTNNVETIIFPDSWDTIDCSLNFLPNLVHVHLPAKLQVIRNRMFRSDDSLEKVDFPTSLTTIESEAFRGCTSLVIESLPDSVTTIADDAFSSSTIRNFKMPGSMIKVPATMFARMELNSINLNNVRTLGVQSFVNTKINELVGLDNVTKIMSEAFRGSNIKEISLNPNVNLRYASFADCNSLGGTVRITENMELASDVFTNCPNLEVVWARPDDVYEFDGIKKLTCSSLCTQLIEANKGYVHIETVEGDIYPITEE